MLGGTYVVGDIHGCYDEWMELKNRIESEDAEAKFILVGDIVDRGPKTFEMIQWAMSNITDDGKYQMILGNHEAEKIDWWRDYKVYIGDDTYTTIDFRSFCSDNYDFSHVMDVNNLNDEQVNEIIEFFKTLPLYKELYLKSTAKKRGKQHFVIVHADYPSKCMNKDESVNKSSLTYSKKYDPIKDHYVKWNIQSVLWNRTYKYRKKLSNTIVIHGHTPTIFEDVLDCYVNVQAGHVIWACSDVNIDCGLVYKDYESRNLCAFRLDDMTPFYLYEK